MVAKSGPKKTRVNRNYRIVRWMIRSLFYRVFYTIWGFPPLIIVSGGGGGTTRLIEHVSQYRNTNLAGDGDGLKHALKPPLRALRSHSRVIYVRGAIPRQISSLERRGTLRFQALKMGGVRAIFCKTRELKKYVGTLIHRQASLFAALNDQKVLVIDYPDFFYSPARIAEWAEIDDPTFIDNFPAYQTPASSPHA